MRSGFVSAESLVAAALVDMNDDMLCGCGLLLLMLLRCGSVDVRCTFDATPLLLWLLTPLRSRRVGFFGCCGRVKVLLTPQKLLDDIGACVDVDGRGRVATPHDVDGLPTGEGLTKSNLPIGLVDPGADFSTRMLYASRHSSVMVFWFHCLGEIGTDERRGSGWSGGEGGASFVGKMDG